MVHNILVYNLLKLKGWGLKKVYTYVKQNFFNYENCLNNLGSVLSQEEKETFKNNLEATKRLFLSLNEKGIKTVSIFDDEFPERLANSTDCCVFLFYKGNIDLLKKPSVSIIGTRKPSQQAVKNGALVSEYFAKRGYVINSGLAIGCDTIAHKTCLNVGGETVAILPSSIDDIQPRQNKSLAEEIVNNNGLLISEVAPGTPYDKNSYAKRDRIQSLLTSVIIVIECDVNSGTMIAVNKHLKDGKHVFGLEGFQNHFIKNRINIDNPDDFKKIEKLI